MIPPSDPLPLDLAEAIAAARDRVRPFGERIIFFNTVSSTNDVAITVAHNGSEGTVVIADEQTAGRGRYGRAWFSPAGAGLYVSIVLRPSAARLDPDRATGLLTLATGVALAEAIEVVAGLRAEIKWPNDLLVAGRKLAGILAETVSVGSSRESSAPRDIRVILGYGINVASTTFPADLGDRATSLASELGRPIDRGSLCAETLAAVSQRYEDLLAGRFDAILEAWRGRAPDSVGAQVTWSTPRGEQRGVTAGIDDRGALLVRTDDRIERIVGGELTWS